MDMCWKGRHGWERSRFVKDTTGKLIPNKLLQLGYVFVCCSSTDSAIVIDALLSVVFIGNGNDVGMMLVY